MARQQTQIRSAAAYQQALDLLYRCRTRVGFVATPTQSDNYHRIWARDGAIIGLASLLTEEKDLIETTRYTFETLARYQGPHGEIPSNVDPVSQRVSYGGTTGRVDANLWFIIGCAEYWHCTQDDNFIQQMIPTLEKVRFLLGAWEFNNRGLIYVPQTGDWADEYLHSGYVLYDQLLYLQALRSLRSIHTALHGSADHLLIERITHLKHLIQGNFWFKPEAKSADNVYHDVLYKKGQEAAKHCGARYWMPFFLPTGYGYRFDALANVLASLLDVSDDEQRELVDEYIDSIVPAKLRLLPAFHPVIQPVDDDWKDLQMTFSYTFKNKPYEFHNGGLWPMITGFYVADLARRNKTAQAQTFLDAIHQANAMPVKEQAPGFAEFIHGRTLRPGGTPNQGWSAAAAIIGERSLTRQPLFRINDD